ncbi:MAG TPA: cytochrome P450 [Thermoanaerobaculia bacterium]|nr:cytochrome P450 [Thermoanaerobaculia bacterium]
MTVAPAEPRPATPPPATQRSSTPLADEARRLPPAPTGLDAMAHLPGERGTPLVGHTLQFVRDARELVARMRDAHGATFRVSMFGFPVLVVGHPDHVKRALMDPGKDFSSRLGWQHAIGELFCDGLMLRDFDEHRLHRKLMQVAFRTEAMRTYLDRMNPLIERGIARWSATPELRFYPAIKQLTLDLAADVFLGMPLGAEADRLNQAFVDSVQASIALIKKPVPPFSYWRGMRGRRLLEEFFARRIADRRDSDGADMFTQLCQATTDEGERFSDREIVDHMIFLLMAAHDTTTSSITTLIWSLAQHPEWQERLREEHAGLGGGALAYDHKDRLPLTEQAFKEALRMYPPVPFIGRRTVREVELDGLRLPKNAGVSVCSLVTHFLPELWSEPHRFDPDRFSPERAEDRRHSHAYYPFGGGAHMCLGMHFAHLQVKAFLVQLLARYRVHLAPGQRVEMVPIPIPKPRNGLPVRLEALA